MLTLGAAKPPGYPAWPCNDFGPGWCTHRGTVTSVTSEPFSQGTSDRWGHAKAGRQLCSKPSTWEGGNSTEEKEQAECSVLACVGMCRKSPVGGEGSTCVFLWALKGLPERQGEHSSSWSRAGMCVNDVAATQGGGAFLPTEGNIPRPLMESHC